MFHVIPPRKVLVAAALLLCVGGCAQRLYAPVELTAAESVFIGWVDVSPDHWLPLGYENKQVWSDVIEWHNQAFQHLCRTQLPGFQVTGAKNRTDENAAGHDLHVRFSEVGFNVKSYDLYVAVHVIDTKSGTEIVRLDRRGYKGGWVSVNSCLQGALEKLATRLVETLSMR